MESLSSVAVQPDPSGARVVLIGASKYETMEDLPAVEHNLGGLRDLLTAPDIWGLPPEHCSVVLNPAFAVEAMETLHTAAAAATSALVVYFAGHGLLDARGDLYLVPGGADHQRIYRGIRYDDVRRELLDTADCPAKVVILDCCYSGRALEGRQSAPGGLAGEAVIEGTFVMTASARDKPAWAPPGEPYTAFTGALIECIEAGLDTQPDLLNMDTLFLHTRQRLKGRNLSVPEQRSRDAGRFIALARNRRGPATIPAAAPSPRPAARIPAPRVVPQVVGEAPQAVGEVPRPSQVAAQVLILRATGRVADADALLVEAGARQSDQGVAALVEQLRDASRPDDLRHVIDGAALREPAEIFDVVQALRTIDLHADARAVLVAAGRRPPDESAPAAALLRTRGATADLAVVIDAALDTARRGQSLIALIDALWLAGFRAEVDALLVGAAHHLDEPDPARVADELRAAGRQEAAFNLYDVAAAAVVARPAAEVAELIGAMHAAGDTERGERLAAAAIAAVATAGAAVELFRALQGAELTEHVKSLVTHSATLPVATMTDIADRLFEHHIDGPALQLLDEVAVDADRVLACVALLRDVGRPVDARKLLGSVARRLPEGETARLLSASAARDTGFLLDVVTNRDLRAVAGLVSALAAIDESDLAVRYATMCATPADVVGALLKSADNRCWGVAALLLRDQLPPDNAAALLVDQQPAGGGLLFRRLLEAGPSPRTDAIVEAIRGGADAVSMLALNCPAERTADLAALPSETVTAALRALHAAGLAQHVRALARLVLWRQKWPEAEMLLRRSLEWNDDALTVQFLAVAVDRLWPLAGVIAGLPETAWRTMLTHLSVLPVEGILRLAEHLTDTPVRLVELLLPHTIPSDVVTGSPAVLAALLALDAPAPTLQGDSLSAASFEGFVAVTKHLMPPLRAKVTVKALRLLPELPGRQLIEACHAIDVPTFRLLVEAVVTDPAGLDGLDLLQTLTTHDPKVVADALQRPGPNAAPEALASAVRRLPARKRLQVAAELDRAGDREMARHLMDVQVWVPDAADPTLLFVADAVQRIGVLSKQCLLFPSNEETLRRIRRKVSLNRGAVLYAILSSGSQETPMVVFTYHEVCYAGTGLLGLLTRIPYTELIHLELAVSGPDRLSVTRPGRSADSWDLSRTGVTAAQLMDLLRKVADAFARGVSAD